MAAGCLALSCGGATRIDQTEPQPHDDAPIAKPTTGVAPSLAPVPEAEAAVPVAGRRRALCGFSDGPMLAFSVNTRVFLLMANGTMRLLQEIAEPEASAARETDLRVGGGHVAVQSSVFNYPDEQIFHHLLLRDDGVPLWQRTTRRPLFRVPAFVVSTQGVLAIENDDGSTAFVRNETDETTADLQVIAPAEDGTLLVRDEAGTHGWYSPDDHAFVALERQPEYSVQWLDNRAFFFAEGSDRELFIADPTGIDVVELPPGVVSQVGVSNGRWALLHALDGSFFVRVDIEDATAEVLSLVEPYGFRFFNGVDSFSYPVQLDQQGRLLRVLRNDVQASVFRSADGGASWIALGPSFANANTARIDVRGGTHLLSTSNRSFYVPPPDLDDEWAEPPPGGEPLLASAKVLFDPSTGTSFELPWNAYTALGPDGTCAAYWDHGDHTMRLVDMEAGTVTELHRSPQASYKTVDMAWAEP